MLIPYCTWWNLAVYSIRDINAPTLLRANGNRQIEILQEKEMFQKPDIAAFEEIKQKNKKIL
jgi:hypothetical protein